MKKLLLSLVAFAGVNLLILFAAVYLLSTHTEKRGFGNATTESNLMVIEQNKHYPLLLMGLSHARNFSRHHHHQRVENILGTRFLNIGQGFGNCGMEIQKEYLAYFLDCGNTADTLLLVASDVMFFSTQLDANPTAFALEPFRPKFFVQLLSQCSNTRVEQLFYYLRYKFSPLWLHMQPDTSTAQRDSLTAIDPDEVATGLKNAYPTGLSAENFDHNKKVFAEIVALAHSRNIQVICITPPSLFGDWPGHAQVKAFLMKQHQLGMLHYSDFGNAVSEPGMYYDHHHLNTRGILYFTRQFLKPLLHGSPAND